MDWLGDGFMKCEKHQKPLEGACQWCGKQLCRYCVGKRWGSKLFCIECAQSSVGHIIERKQLEEIRKQEQVESKKRDIRKIFEDY
ncbi:hypothetical protein HY488_01970 [Candidatus Woesearchaeota archaeon]|nr:hypothetical protein [Candidatus Woesearchaeota archaeon]